MSKSPTKRRVPRKKRDTAELKGDILSAAVNAFARHGYEGASLSDIAAQAKTQHPVILYHFASKELLWRQAMARIFDELRADLAAVADLSRDLSALDQFRLVIRTFVRFSSRNPARVTLIVLEMREGTDRLTWLMDEHLGHLLQRLNDLLDRVEQQGLVKPVPRHHLAYILVGAVTTFFMAEPVVKRFFDVDVLEPDVVNAHADWIVDILLNGVMTGAA
ncbi:TetR/AcrR family transcriptional regulator [Erythrobacter aureus]|uniref:TetR/AcrR family transcriptional regulator n=1 Tax=Erythrobacter aureus TaxID=2182384 RepID=UPI003A8CABA5